jgi:hypothetical protein
MLGRGFASIVALALLAVASACTTVENDPTTNSAAALYQTRVDFMPPSRSERIAQIAHEDRVLADTEARLQGKIDTLHKEREALFEQLAAKFPECRSQKHCLSFLTKGDAKKFEEFREERAVLGKVDAEIGETESTLALWRRRRDLRVRSIYNRYLVNEVLGAAKLDERIGEILVHSAEAYPDRQTLSRRLVSLAGPNIVPMMVGDLDFRMMNKPVDEAAVILTLDVRLRTGGRYLSTLLVNTHQLDPQFYEQGFQSAWARKFAQPDILRRETYCGVYSIASSLLLAKLGAGKAKPCAEMRENLQSLDAARYKEANRPDNWMLPVSYRAL